MSAQFIVPATAPDQRYTEEERASAFDRLNTLAQEKNATVIAHYYVDAAIQAFAEQSGGFVGDSLAMAKFGMQSSADLIVVAGVKFMGETAKILSPDKKVVMPTLEATCSLDLGCPIEAFNAFCDAHPDRIVVVYANTSAAVKARADWVVTSSNALKIVDHLDAQGEKILWAPDKYLGSYIQAQTGADMLLWDGSCVVHEEFKAKALRDLKAQYPDAAILVHPESPPDVIALATVVGSTSQLLKAVETHSNDTFIVATDRGIFYKMQQLAPEKKIIEAPTAGKGATCRSCAHCPWMAMNALSNLEAVLESETHEIVLPQDIITQAQRSLTRMVTFNQ